MRKTMIVLVALIGSALMFSAAAAATKPDPGTKDARKLTQQQCKAEKKADKAAFKAVYGKRAMRTCKKGEKSETKAEIKNASQECKAEEAADPDAFAATYGSGKNGKNAFGKCVSSKVKAENRGDVAEFKNAAKECKAERAGDKDAFRETYGSEKSKGRNAFGKCVSSKAAAEDENEEEPTDEV